MAGINYEDLAILDAGDNMGDETAPLIQHRSTISLRRELTESTAEAFYKSLNIKPPNFIDPNDFERDDGGHLFVKIGPNREQLVQLTDKRDSSKFVGMTTIKQRLRAEDRNRLGIVKPPKPAREAVAKFQNPLQELPTVSQNIELQDLIPTADRIINTIEEAETSLSEETALKTINDSPIPPQELEVIDRTVRKIRDELKDNLAKLSEIDEHIKREKEKLVEADDANLGSGVKERITQRLKDLEKERAARLKAASTNRDQLRTQVIRIRETIQRILYEDTTLAERIKTLFREQGVTLASVITALGFAISTLVMAITGGGGGQSSVPPPPSPDKSWVKKQLDHLASLLKKISW